jgi:Putative prokaryotic signal transducing protein
VKGRRDPKLEEVAVGQFRYRHEAEFAAGFLRDAGIPYRLQIDDAGGADFGLLHLRPALLWVRAVDAERARDLLAPDEEADAAWEPSAPDEDSTD